MKLLRHRKAEQIQDRFKAGSAWDNPLDLVFTNALGGCLCGPDGLYQLQEDRGLYRSPCGKISRSSTFIRSCRDPLRG